MSWKEGLNFRVSVAFVTDGADETCARGDVSGPDIDLYPTTRDGLTFGYSASNSAEGRNRNAGVDRRLAGTHFNTAFPSVVRLDLPAAGEYLCRAAFGDFYVARDNGVVTVFDDATQLFTIDHATGWTTAENRWRDANDALHDSADVTWLESATRSVTFESTICYIHLGAASGSRTGYLAHFSLEQVEAGGEPTQGGAYHQVIQRTRGYGRWT